MNAPNLRAVQAARLWIGTPYRHQSAQQGAGCDCLGLIVGVWRALNGARAFELPPYSNNWRDRSHASALKALAQKHLYEVDKAPLVQGSVVLMQLRSGLPAKHCAIIADDDHFIHAQERIGVVEVPLSNWWRRRIVAQYKFPERP
ncbi:NlpC/P60 family protein [Maritalea porphyrae]|uniref:NlpC/P60 family protein n=1 Tax=Maritalea porphyrae TaxID=880732 RepID=UPI0022AEFD5F|nr:NlpC/P60 family protein [Maritalea porphyrae]MCZ4271150.1 NlpC/P60 family protein [Maritalea porphyrae]